ncbi:hypothetical protein BC829DRAFT_389384 [Chytridium lagenaria]|nr:hypothetical protein BC829DRAFT_389384 [Chytridium lagenaria]
MSTDFSVSVIGGGLRGWKVTIYELRGGAGAEADILPNVIPMRARMIHVGTGKLMSQKYGVFGECINSIDRKLVNANLLTLAETHPNVSVVFGYELKSVDFHKKTLVFNSPDGKVVNVVSDLIVGCDGAYSKVRQNLMKVTRMNFSQEYIEHGYVELNMPPGADGEYQMDPNHLHIWPRQTFMLIALPNLDKSFTVTLFMPWSKFEAIKNENDLLTFFDETFPDAVALIGRKLLASDYFKNPKGPLVSIKCKPYNYRGSAVIIAIGERGSAKSKHPDAALVEAALNEYSRVRHADAVAICDLAMYNYVEMRSSVVKFSYLLRKNVESFLHRVFPKAVIPLYTMVSFSRIPYSEALARFGRQTKCLWSSLTVVAAGGALVGLRYLKNDF